MKPLFAAVMLVVLVGCAGGDPASAGDASSDAAAPPFTGPDAAIDAADPFGTDVVVAPGDGLVAVDGVLCVPYCVDRACGDDGCGGACGQCGLGTACHDGACLEGPVEGPACAEAWPCVEACGEDVGCARACADAWPPAAGARLDRALTCREAGCSICPDALCRAHCLLEQCEDAWLGCFHGEATCADVVACVGTCEDSACVAGCAREGSKAAQVAWYELVFCVAERCESGEPGCESVVTGPGGQCHDPLLACAGP